MFQRITHVNEISPENEREKNPSPTKWLPLTPRRETTQPRTENDYVTLSTHTTSTEYPSIKHQASPVLPEEAGVGGAPKSLSSQKNDPLIMN